MPESRCPPARDRNSNDQINAEARYECGGTDGKEQAGVSAGWREDEGQSVGGSCLQQGEAGCGRAPGRLLGSHVMRQQLMNPPEHQGNNPGGESADDEAGDDQPGLTGPQRG